MSLVYDVMLLYNENEPFIEEIGNELRYSGYSVFLWRDDVPYGSDVAVEIEKFDETATILVLLGQKGWGPNHLRIAEEAVNHKKRVLTIRIGDFPPDDDQKLSGLFADKRYYDLQVRNEKTYDGLMKAIGEPKVYRQSNRYDSIIAILADGDNEARIKALENIRASKTINRAGLSNRLREDIRTRFAEVQAGTFTNAARYPQQLSIIRSWLLVALIENDAEDDLNKELLLDYLRPDMEPYETNRYWLLATLHRCKASYLYKALNVVLSDHSPVMLNLARAMENPGSEELVNAFTIMLESQLKEQAWVALRVMRVVPMPLLAKDVVKFILLNINQENELVYDAYYALDHPSTAYEAASILNSNSRYQFVERMLTELAKCEPNAIRNFASILTFFGEPEIYELLDTMPSRHNDIIKKVRGTLKHFFKSLKNTGKELFISGYHADNISVAEDQLEIGQEIKTLTAIMLAKEVKPPLAIGLFGNWGSGKSFFIESLEEEVKNMQAQYAPNENISFCTKIVQIKFNAWHYVDTNLWASLMDVIFDKLDAYVSPRETIQEKEKGLNTKLAKAEAEYEKATKAKDDTILELNEKREKLQLLRESRENDPVKFSELTRQDIEALLNDSQKAALKNALNKLGIPDLVHNIAELRGTLMQAKSVQGRMNSLINRITSSKNGWMIIGGLFLGVIILPIIFWLIHHFGRIDKWFTIISAFFAEITGIIGTVVLVLKNGLSYAKSALNVVESTTQTIEDQLNNKRKEVSEAEKQLQLKINELQNELTKKTQAAVEAEQDVDNLKKEKVELEEEYSLTHFLSDRSHSEDYRQHQGIISRIRKDFDSLTDRIERSQQNKQYKRVERIILYIDDLDRCPTDKIMEVLQAVHLMLAYRLFVVIVGVDPRWLLHSLHSNFTALQYKENDVWRTTPQAFLEKIFQIPFFLKPMSSEGFERLIGHLFTTSPKQTTQEETIETPVIPHTEPMNTNYPAAAASTVQPVEGSQAPYRPTQETFTVSEASMTIQLWEEGFAAKLYFLIHTPRSAKRFTNIYRIIKAYVQQEDLPIFEGSAEAPGEFQVPMLLLALQTGGQDSQADIMKELYRQALQGKGLKTAFLHIVDQRGKHAAISNMILGMKDIDLVPKSADPVLQWLPLVARFSFEATEILSIPGNGAANHKGMVRL